MPREEIDVIQLVVDVGGSRIWLVGRHCVMFESPMSVEALEPTEMGPSPRRGWVTWYWDGSKIGNLFE